MYAEGKIYQFSEFAGESRLQACRNLSKDREQAPEGPVHLFSVPYVGDFVPVKGGYQFRAFEDPDD